MKLFRLLCVGCVGLALPLASTGDPPRPPAAVSPITAGKWRVEFANGVVETVETRADATATVAEPARTAGGRVTSLTGAAVVVYDDDRVERWTAVGGRMVVEHWFPAAQFPNGAPVRGIADKTD